MIVWDCIQGSGPWWELHRGRLTASSMDKLITPKTLQPSASMTDLIYRLLGEKYMLGSMIPNNYVSPAAQHGLDTEDEARRWYEMEFGCDCQRIGFATTDDERFGCSPDFLIGEEGLLQIKCPQPTAHVRYLLTGSLPADYTAQIHGEMIVCGRQWNRFLSYCPGFEPFLVHVEPNGFTAKLREALDLFWTRFLEADDLLLSKKGRAAESLLSPTACGRSASEPITPRGV